MAVVAPPLPPPPISSIHGGGQKQQQDGGGGDDHGHLFRSSAARTAGAMLAVLLRVSLICHLLLHLLPKKVRSLLPHSWLHDHHNHHHPCPPPPPPPLSSVAAAGAGAVEPEPPRSAMDPQELKRVFQMFDRNGDGRITKAELSDSLANLGIFIPDADLAAMIDKIDANRDGCVDLDEFGELYQAIMDDSTDVSTGGGGEEEEDMREAFNVFDQNGDGFITVDELRSVLASLGLKQGRTVDDCRKMISKVDVDGDGMVDFNEFKQMMRGGGFAALS